MTEPYQPRGVTVGLHLAGLLAMSTFFTALLVEEFTSWTFPFWLATLLIVLTVAGVGATVRLWFMTRDVDDD